MTSNMVSNVFNRTLYSLEIDTEAITTLRKLPTASYYFQVKGRPVYSIDDLEPNVPFQIHFRLCGGKGGFGSLLKSFRIHRSTNQLMCRNLSGRRLADVKEEERLRKWIAKSAEREREKQRKKQEKYEKLKNGGRTKHEFNDPEYLRKRDIVLDETEDAVEAGMSALKRATPEPGPSKPRVATPEDFSSDSDGDVPLKKCKIAPIAYDPPEKKQILESKYLNEKVGKKKKLSIPQKIVIISKKVNDKEKAEKLIEKAPLAPKEFLLVDLQNYGSSAELELLGLDHLKHALETRGLKCGGSLQERAHRLFSAKGLAPEQYPKNIKAFAKKK